MRIFNQFLNQVLVICSISDKNKIRLFQLLNATQNDIFFLYVTTDSNKYQVINQAKLSLILNMDSNNFQLSTFSSSSNDISIVHGLIQEGRDCMKRSFVYFRFLITSAIINHFSMMIVIVYAENFNENMILFQEFFIYLPLCFFMKNFQNKKKLKKQVTQTSILSL